MTTLSLEHLRADGHILSTYANGLQVLDGVDGAAARRQSRLRYAYKDGGIPNDYNLYAEPKQIPLRLWVAPTDADGVVSHAAGGLGHIRDNLDALLQIFGKTGSAIAMTKRVFTGASATAVNVLEADAKVPGGVRIGGAAMLRYIDLTLELDHPFWLDQTDTAVALSGGSDSDSTTPLGTAPVSNMRITFGGAAELTDGYGATITATGACVVNVKNRTIGSTASNNTRRNRVRFSKGWWMRWFPDQAVSLTKTGAGTIDIDYQDAYH